MKFFLLLSVLVSVVIGVVMIETPAVNSVMQGGAAGEKGVPVINAAEAVRIQAEAAAKARAEAVQKLQAQSSSGFVEQ